MKQQPLHYLSGCDATEVLFTAPSCHAYFILHPVLRCFPVSLCLATVSVEVTASHIPYPDHARR